MLSHRAHSLIQRELDRANRSPITLIKKYKGRTSCKNIVWKFIGQEVALQKKDLGSCGQQVSQQCALLART